LRTAAKEGEAAAASGTAEAVIRNSRRVRFAMARAIVADKAEDTPVAGVLT
jgi:hypothetical protein